MAGDYGCGKYRVLLWLDHCEDFSLGHSAAFGHRRRTGHQALLLWIPCKFAIQSTKLAELSKELTATITDGHVPPSPLLCPLLRVHCDAWQDSSYLWATENRSHFWVSWATSQASPFTENDTEHSRNRHCPCSGSKHTDDLGGILSDCILSQAEEGKAKSISI